jgi:purine-cytosine permease-like protein
MFGLESRNQGSLLRLPHDWSGQSAVAERRSSGGPSPALLITGAVVIGLGFLAWTYLGADLKRYIKIYNM